MSLSPTLLPSFTSVVSFLASQHPERVFIPGRRNIDVPWTFNSVAHSYHNPVMLALNVLLPGLAVWIGLHFARPKLLALSPEAPKLVPLGLFGLRVLAAFKALLSGLVRPHSALSMLPQRIIYAPRKIPFVARPRRQLPLSSAKATIAILTLIDLAVFVHVWLLSRAGAVRTRLGQLYRPRLPRLCLPSLSPTRPVCCE